MAREQQSVGGRLGDHNAVPRCGTDDWVKCVRLRRSSASITMSSTCPIQSGSFSGNSRLQHWQICSVTFSMPLATIGSVLALDVINLQWYIFHSVVLRSCVTASLPGGEYTLVELTIESPWSVSLLPSTFECLQRR